MGTVNDSARNDIENLEVIARCECGCASVDFGSPAAEARPSPIADGTATRPSGGQIGVIVWGRSDAITGLEIYGLGDGNDDLVLPIPESIVPW